MPPAQIRVLLTTLIRRIDLHADRIELHTSPGRLTAALGILLPAGVDDHAAEPDLVLAVPTQLRRAGKEIAMRIDPRAGSPASPNPSLIKLIVRAHLFHGKLMQQGGGKYHDLANGEELNRSYFSRVLRLAYLAPDITRAILDAHQPPGLTAARLINDSHLPLAWPEPRKALGFA